MLTVVTGILTYLVKDAAKATLGAALVPLGLYMNKAYEAYTATGALPPLTTSDLIFYAMAAITTYGGVWAVPNRKS
jgi:hypothetical protein